MHGTSTSAAHESPLLNVTASANEAVRALVELACDCTGREAPPPALGSSPSDHALVEAIGQIERMKNSLDAAQSRLEVQLRHVRVRAEREAGLPVAKAGSGVGHEVGLARRISPAAAGNQLSLRRVLVESLPRTLALLEAGEISGWAAEEVSRAVVVLDDDERATVDAEIAARLPELTARGAGRVARAVADRLNAKAAVERVRRSTAQRTVTQRAAGEGMMRLTALLPTHEGVAAYAALAQAASAAKATGDQRSRGAVMADTLMQRVTGAAEGEVVPVEIHLLMTDTALLGDGADVALIDGHPIPGPVARNLALTGALFPETQLRDPDAAGAAPSAAQHRPDPGAAPAPMRWIRRLYADPVSGDLTAIDARRRAFSGQVRTFISARDQRCRGPWCDAPIRHVHHVHGYASGGETTPANGVGTCERLNHVAELPGWSTRISAEGGGGDLILTTPSGHSYRSSPPRLREELCAEPSVSNDAGDSAPPDERALDPRQPEGAGEEDFPYPPWQVVEEWFVPDSWIPVEDLEPF